VKTPKKNSATVGQLITAEYASVVYICMCSSVLKVGVIRLMDVRML